MERRPWRFLAGGLVAALAIAEGPRGQKRSARSGAGVGMGDVEPVPI
jgi:hypothetical protein